MVEVVAGEEKGKRGRVLKVIPKKDRVVVEGVNYITKHVRQSQRTVEAGRVEREGSIALSNVLPVCEKCGRGVRVGFRLDENKKKVRYCKTKGCNAVV
jgi:large subunit ribosomal protein L24